MITVSDSRKEIVVTFRGTLNLYNALLDIKLFSVKYEEKIKADDDIRIHIGVFKATMSLYPKVVPFPITHAMILFVVNLLNHSYS